MSQIERSITEITGCGPDRLNDELLSSDEPLVLRGLVSAWPLVRAAKQSAQAADAYLRQYCCGVPVTASVGPPEIEGRIFYNEDLTGFNFEPERTRLEDVLDRLRQLDGDAHPPVHYVGSTSIDYCLPGLREDNDLNLAHLKPMISLWLGNRTRIAAHYDIPDNIACVAVGRRRFTLFPPDQLENLYVGPLDFAPAGQAISMVDVRHPDFDRYPRFRTALRRARSAELAPGDAIFVPGMWWHNVEGLESLNVLVNYWWRTAPAYMGSPLDVLNHALLSIRDLPEAQRNAWRDIFEHYVFDPTDAVHAHIPEHSRGVLAPIDDQSARRLRALLLKRLNR